MSIVFDRSPTGHMLLTRLQRGFKLWDEDGVCRRTVDRKASVQSINWFPGGEGNDQAARFSSVLSTFRSLAFR